jgi:F0F1-type ATP synthase assembly protein I
MVMPAQLMQLEASRPDPRKPRARRSAMRTSEAFVIGATVGVVVGWLWGRDRVGERTRRVRTKALTAHW